MEVQKTALYNYHKNLGAKFVPFAGYEMPIQYKDGIVKEHISTRTHAGFFDVSHMGQFFLEGDETLIESLEKIIPIEFVIRNIATGSLTKRLGIEEGTVLDYPLIEYCLKDDKLGDPIISRELILTFNWLNIMQLDWIDENLSRLNDFLLGMFRGVGIKLVDFKVEFGFTHESEKNQIILADEISPDTCRLWDTLTDKKLDKDRFRKNLGNVMQAYQDVARRLGILHEESNIRAVKFPKPKAVKIKKK